MSGITREEAFKAARLRLQDIRHRLDKIKQAGVNEGGGRALDEATEMVQDMLDEVIQQESQELALQALQAPPKDEDE